MTAFKAVVNIKVIYCVVRDKDDRLLEIIIPYKPGDYSQNGNFLIHLENEATRNGINCKVVTTLLMTADV